MPGVIDYESRARPDSPVVGAWVLGVLGAVAGVICTLFSLGMTGAGHGWMAPVFVSWVALLAAPAAGVAWAYRGRAGSVAAALVLLFISLLADAWLVGAAKVEGVYYVRRVWNAMPVFLLVWAASWLVWQLTAAAILIRSLIVKGLH